MKSLGTVPGAISIAVLAATTSPLAYAGDGIAELLLKKGVISADEYKQLKQETGTSAPTASSAPAPAPSPAPAMPNISFAKGFVVSSIDGSYSAQLGTLMQLDAAAYSDDESNNSAAMDNNSGTEMRRGRLYLQGTVQKDWQYKFELELFGNSGTELTDGYVRYNGFKPFESTKPLAVTIGHFKVPFSLEQLMSDKDLSLMERSLPNAFLKSRAPGAMIATSGAGWSAAAMGFGEQLYSNTYSSDTPQQDEGGGASARFTWAPLVSDSGVLHFGVSGQYVEPKQKGGGATISYSSRPESHMTSLSLIRTGSIGGDVDHAKLLGAEIAATYGPVTLQSEYIRAEVARDIGDDPTFSGWYAQAAWMLTGEKRPHDVGGGIFKAISPAHPTGTTDGYGAWELVARYSTLDLNDASISGGRERNATLGLGWYANNFVRISGNWVHVFDIDGGKYDDASLDALQMRFQFAY